MVVFHKGIITTFSKFLKTGFETILVFVVGIADKCRLSAVEHDVVADMSYGIINAGDIMLKTLEYKN
jgi:hypothetical protein